MTDWKSNRFQNGGEHSEQVSLFCRHKQDMVKFVNEHSRKILFNGERESNRTPLAENPAESSTAAKTGKPRSGPEDFPTLIDYPEVNTSIISSN